MLHYKELFPLGPFGSKMPAWCPATPSTSVSVSDTKGHVLGGHTVTVKIGTYARPVTHLTLSFHSCPSSADVLDVCVSCPLALFTGGCSSFLTLETCHLGEQRLAHVQRAPSPLWGLPGVSGLESGACPGPAQCVRKGRLPPSLALDEVALALGCPVAEDVTVPPGRWPSASPFHCEVALPSTAVSGKIKQVL